MNEKEWESIPCNQVKVGDFIYFIAKGEYNRKTAYSGTVRGSDVLGSNPFRIIFKPKAKIMLGTDDRIRSHKVRGNVWRKKV